MGLGIYVGEEYCFGSSYSDFHEFRQRLAESIGLELMSMEGYNPNGIPWDTVDDALAPLLYHSDCKGVLTPEECAKIATRLREIFDARPKTENENGYPKTKNFDEYHKRQALKLIEAMEMSVETNQPLEFS